MYTIKSIWRTLQGEGFFAGRPAVFVRMVGCNMWSGYEDDRSRDAGRHGADCPLWCDTDFTKEGSSKLSAEDLARHMLRVGGDIRFCVLTGGEPFLQADAELIRQLHEAGFQVAVETNGTVALADAFETRSGEELPKDAIRLDAPEGKNGQYPGTFYPPDWIVCSPKLPASELKLEYCHELKLVVPDYRPEHYAAFAQRVRPQPLAGREQRLLWLQPEDGPRYEEARQEAVDMALSNPDWRVSTQTHKVLGVE